MECPNQWAAWEFLRSPSVQRFSSCLPVTGFHFQSTAVSGQALISVTLSLSGSVFRPRVPVLTGVPSECEKKAPLFMHFFTPGSAGSPLLHRLPRAVCGSRGPSRAAVRGSSAWWPLSLQAMSSQLCPGLAASRHVGPGAEPVVPALAGGFLTPGPAGTSRRKRVLLWSMPSIDVCSVQFSAAPCSPTAFPTSACRLSLLPGAWQPPTITVGSSVSFLCSP